MGGRWLNWRGKNVQKWKGKIKGGPCKLLSLSRASTLLPAQGGVVGTHQPEELRGTHRGEGKDEGMKRWCWKLLTLIQGFASLASHMFVADVPTLLIF